MRQTVHAVLIICLIFMFFAIDWEAYTLSRAPAGGQDRAAVATLAMSGQDR